MHGGLTFNLCFANNRAILKMAEACWAALTVKAVGMTVSSEMTSCL